MRDAVFRRLLGLADLGAAAGGLYVAGALRGHGAGVVAVLTIPLIVLIAKMTGRYDHDEVVLRKSTLDEIPALLALAAAFMLAWSVVAFVAGHQPRLHDSGVALLWVSTAVLLIAGRLGARAGAVVGSGRARADRRQCHRPGAARPVARVRSGRAAGGGRLPAAGG